MEGDKRRNSDYKCDESFVSDLTEEKKNTSLRFGGFAKQELLCSVNKVSDIQRPIVHPARDVPVEMKARGPPESADLVPTKNPR